MTSNGVSEEEVMRMRLLVDGDGMGDDRKLNMMLKVFVRYPFVFVIIVFCVWQALVKWCNSETEDQASCEQTYQRMLTQVLRRVWITILMVVNHKYSFLVLVLQPGPPIL